MFVSSFEYWSYISKFLHIWINGSSAKFHVQEQWLDTDVNYIAQRLIGQFGPDMIGLNFKSFGSVHALIILLLDRFLHVFSKICTLSNEGHKYTIPETWLNS